MNKILLSKQIFYWFKQFLKKKLSLKSQIITENHISVQNFFYKYLLFRVRNVLKFKCGTNKPLYVALNALFITIIK